MMIDELFDMKVKDLLEEFCLVYSPECGYNYGITKCEDAEKIYEKFDLEDEYCFDTDPLIPIDYGFDSGEEVLTLETLEEIMDKLGIIKKQSCPKCNSPDCHLDYNDLMVLCNNCGNKFHGQHK